MRFSKTFAIIVALIALSFPVVQMLLDANLAFGLSMVPSGATIDVTAGVVKQVTPHSIASAAGLRVGDRIDYAKTGWPFRLWLRYGHFPAEKAAALPVIRENRPLTLTLTAPKSPPLPANLWAVDIARILGSLLYVTLGCAFYFFGGTILSRAFMLFCVGGVAAYTINTSWMHVSPPWMQPVSALVASLPAIFVWGYLTFCLRFPTGEAVGRWRVIDKLVIPWTLIVFAVYYAHFYTVTFISHTTGNVSDAAYWTFTAMALFTNIFGAIAFLARYRFASGADFIRMRWVVFALVLYLATIGIFFFDQIMQTQWTWVSYLTLFNPAPFAFAYALVRGRIVDVRVAGGRALVYAILSAIPVALLGVIDWFFARRLQDARLATILEVALAVAFSFWLRGLHLRIDRFVERVFFARRHRAFERVRHITRALPFTEKISTIENMMSHEVAAALQLASVALFREQDGTYVRAAADGWDGCSEQLDADDPLILFARSAGDGVHLYDLPRTHAAIPRHHAKPAFALPVTVGRRSIAIVLFANHYNGEPIDAEEETLLNGLARSAAAAYEHLHALEREREISFLRAQLKLQTSA